MEPRAVACTCELTRRKPTARANLREHTNTDHGPKRNTPARPSQSKKTKKKTQEEEKQPQEEGGREKKFIPELSNELGTNGHSSTSGNRNGRPERRSNRRHQPRSGGCRGAQSEEQQGETISQDPILTDIDCVKSLSI